MERRQGLRDKIGFGLRLWAALAVALMVFLGGGSPASAAGCGEEYSKSVDRAKRDIHDWRIRMNNAGQVKNFISWLEERDRSVRLHEEAHRDAACEYAGKVNYYQYRYRGKDYRMAGCVNLPGNMPDELRYLAAMAPRALHNDELSSADKAIADDAKERLDGSRTAWTKVKLCKVAEEVREALDAGRPSRSVITAESTEGSVDTGDADVTAPTIDSGYGDSEPAAQVPSPGAGEPPVENIVTQGGNVRIYRGRKGL